MVGGVCVFIYSFPLMDSRMYMIREGNEMLVVDPCEDETLLRDAEGVQKALVLLTHEHYDHVSGVNWLRAHFDCRVYAGSICAERVHSEKDNLSSRFAFLFLTDREKYDYVRRNMTLPYVCEADESFCGTGILQWKSHTLAVYEVGGHSPGSCLIVLDQKLLFGGDNILGNGQELRNAEGDEERYGICVMPFLEQMDDKTYVLPGHGEGNTLEFFLPYLKNLKK